MAIYREDDMKLDVDVLEDNSDAEWHRYVLRVKEILRPHFLCKPPGVGETFDCERRKDCRYGGMWTLNANETELAAAAKQ